MLYLKAWRGKKGLEQTALAEKCGVTQAAISNIEKEKVNPTARTLSKLARGLGITIPELFTNPNRFEKLTRHDIDDVAKSIINGQLPADSSKKDLVAELSLLISQKLQALDKPGKRFAAKQRWNNKSRYVNARQKYSDLVVNQVLNRVEKLLA